MRVLLHSMIAGGLLSVLIVSFSVANAEINDGLGESFPQTSKPASVTPAAPKAGAPVMTGEGRVLEIINGSGYSYMHLEEKGQKFWVAGTHLSVKKGDRVSFEQSVVMNGFTSKSLNRTFEQLIFASAVKVTNN